MAVVCGKGKYLFRPGAREGEYLPAGRFPGSREGNTVKIASSVKARILLGLIIPLLVMAGVVAGVAIWKMRDTALSDFTAKSQQELELFGFYVD